MYKIILFFTIWLCLECCKSSQVNKPSCYQRILIELDSNWIYNDTFEYYIDNLPFYKLIEDNSKYRCLLNKKLDTNTIIEIFGTPSQSSIGLDSNFYLTYCTYPTNNTKYCCRNYYTFIFYKNNILREIYSGQCTGVD